MRACKGSTDTRCGWCAHATAPAPPTTLQTPRDKNNAILAAALIIVVTLTCIMSYLQERSASNVMGEHAD